ncbi:MAG: hypothetical protein IKZ39_02670, partial [Lachnospiraceae bacterium]|nr:hypothetical protein [Lachnospiraceae bacterium]
QAAFRDEMEYYSSLDYIYLINYTDDITEYNDEWDYAYCEYYFYEEDATYYDYSIYAFPKNSDQMLFITVDTSGEDDNLDFNNLLSILNYMHPE